jgi:MFS family permease
MGAVAGVVGPLVISALIEAYPGIWGWRIAFLISFAQGIIGTAVWFKFQTSKPVPELNSPTSTKLGWYKDT